MNLTSFISAFLLIQLVACATEPQVTQPHFSDQGVSRTSEDLSGPIVENLMAELKQKNVMISRWGEISKNFAKLKTGMPQEEVENLLGKRDPYPEDRPSIWQHLPDQFSGSRDGDWNLVIHMKDKKISGFRLLKYAYGPPPG